MTDRAAEAKSPREAVKMEKRIVIVWSTLREKKRRMDARMKRENGSYLSLSPGGPQNTQHQGNGSTRFTSSGLAEVKLCIATLT